MNTPHMSIHAASSCSVNRGSTRSTTAPASARRMAAVSTAAAISGSTAQQPRSTLRPRRSPVRSGSRFRERSSGVGSERMSASSGPWVAARNRRASSALRARGPWCEIVSKRPGRTSIGIRPSPGFRPTTPLQAAGMRTEPPMSDPSARATQPDATAAALPPDEPPGVRRGSYGLRVTPQSGLSVCRVWANSGVVVWPMMIAPARAQRGDDVGVAIGHPVLEGVRAEGRAMTGDGRGVLHGDRHAVEDAEGSSVVATGDGLGGSGSGLPGLVVPYVGEAVQVWLHGRRAVDRRRHGLDGRELAGGDECRRVLGGPCRGRGHEVGHGATVQSPARPGRIAQLVRALPLQGRSRRFESVCAHQVKAHIRRPNGRRTRVRVPT